MSSTLMVEVPGLDATQIAREAIAAKLTEAMLGQDDTIRKIVVAAMATKVDDHGNVNRSSYENKTSFIEWIAHDLIRSITKEIVKEKVALLRPAIEKEIGNSLVKQKGTIARMIADQFIKTAGESYRLTVNVAATPYER